MNNSVLSVNANIATRRTPQLLSACRRKEMWSRLVRRLEFVAVDSDEPLAFDAVNAMFLEDHTVCLLDTLTYQIRFAFASNT
jgi:hypothetical protein